MRDRRRRGFGAGFARSGLIDARGVFVGFIADHGRDFRLHAGVNSVHARGVHRAIIRKYRFGGGKVRTDKFGEKAPDGLRRRIGRGHAVDNLIRHARSDGIGEIAPKTLLDIGDRRGDFMRKFVAAGEPSRFQTGETEDRRHGRRRRRFLLRLRRGNAG